MRYSSMPCSFLVSTLVLIAVVAETVIPNPVREADVQTCEKELQTLKDKRVECEKQIDAARDVVSAKIDAYKTYFSDVESQMNRLEPQVEAFNNDMRAKYAKEAEAYRALQKESSRVKSGAFLHRRGQPTSGCPAECHTPSCLPGDLSNGGASLINGKCMKYASRPYGMYRYCGDAANYEVGDFIRCGGCLQEVLTDRWMMCDDNKKLAQLQLDSCNTKAVTVNMWDLTRQRQYKDKADVYIMRVSRQADPLNAKIRESARVDATISRINRQVQELRSNLPIASD